MSEERLNNIETLLRISEAFERLTTDIEAIEKRLDRLEHGQNRIQASLDVILRHITGVGQEPPQE
jgi:chaperonin cofactor prefoldin